MRRTSYFVFVTALAVTLSLAFNGYAADPPRGHLGVMVSPGEGGRGVVVREVAPDGPAAKAGLKAGDRVVKVGDQDVADVAAFHKAVAAHNAGDKLALTVTRDGKEQALTATLGERPTLPLPPGDQPPAYLGVQVRPLTAELRKTLKVEAEDGVVVAEVAPNSPAEKAGLKRDDVITAAGGHAVKSPEDLRDEVQLAGAGKELALSVVRGGEKLALKATPRAGSVSFFLPPGDDRFPFPDIAPMFDRNRRVRELERRVEELEKRVRELEAKAGRRD